MIEGDRGRRCSGWPSNYKGNEGTRNIIDIYV